MVHNVQHLCLFVVVIVVVYSSDSYAPAEPLWNGPSKNVPTSSVKGSCPGWLQFEGLTDNCVEGEESNMARAIERVKSFDQGKHVWAACYAYFISSFTLSNPEHWSIQGYCGKVNPNNELTPFLKLQNAKTTCIGWLNAYGYVEDVEHNSVNAQMAIYRRKENDKDPHFLVAMFSKYLENRLEELKILYPQLPENPSDYFSAVKSLQEFCALLENAVASLPAKQIPFANLDTKMLCHKWIMLSGYSDKDVQNNTVKAMNQDEQFKKYHSRWTIEYIDYLRAFDSNVESWTPEEFCIIKEYLYPVYYDRGYDNDVN